MSLEILRAIVAGQRREIQAGFIWHEMEGSRVVLSCYQLKCFGWFVSVAASLYGTHLDRNKCLFLVILFHDT